VASLRSLLGNRRWLLGFAAEGRAGCCMWSRSLLRRSRSCWQPPLAVSEILAIMVSRLTRGPLSSRERIGALLSMVGLALLGVSLLGSHSEGSVSGYVWISVWLVASAIAPVVLIWFSRVIGGGPGWGLAAGILFAAGDVSTKMAVSGGAANVAFLACLIIFYAVGTAVLQAGVPGGWGGVVPRPGPRAPRALPGPPR